MMVLCHHPLACSQATQGRSGKISVFYAISSGLRHASRLQVIFARLSDVSVEHHESDNGVQTFMVNIR
jgi:hypothetical protein